MSVRDGIPSTPRVGLAQNGAQTHRLLPGADPGPLPRDVTRPGPWRPNSEHTDPLLTVNTRTLCPGMAGPKTRHVTVISNRQPVTTSGLLSAFRPTVFGQSRPASHREFLPFGDAAQFPISAHDLVFLCQNSYAVNCDFSCAVMLAVVLE